MDYKEIDFTIEPLLPYKEILIAQLAEIGFDSFVDKEDGLLAYAPISEWSEVRFDFVIQGIAQGNTVTYTEKIIEQQNWNAEWEKQFDPIFIGDQCVIKAPFHQDIPSYPYEVIIEPQMSFGTGHHETTFLMAQSILNLSAKDKDVLDMGCGTGVLAILAKKTGAKYVQAIDIEEWAYQNTKDNIIKNKLNNIEVKQGGKEQISGKFDVVLANINRNILLDQMNTYFDSLNKNGVLKLSGIFTSDQSVIVEKAEEVGFKFVQMIEKNTWAMLEFTKSH